MRSFKDDKFFQLKEDYSKLLQELGMNLTNSRFAATFKTFSAVKQSPEYLADGTIPKNLIASFRNALFDLTELQDIYDAIQDYPDRAIVKEKLVKLNSGHNIHSDETSKNNVARNTQFELKLFSELKKAGLGCYLKEPNPDIEILNVGRSYAVECKRLFAFNEGRIKSNVNDARDQLEKILKVQPHKTGVIAIDITRNLTNGDSYLEAKNSKTALARLEYELENFRKQHEMLWSPRRVRNERITAILIHVSLFAYLKEEAIYSHGAYTLIQPIHPTIYGKMMFDQAYQDVYLPIDKSKQVQ
jgi:hypothetical protein